MRTTTLRLALGWALAAASGLATAQPAPEQRMDSSLLQRQDLPYRFSSLQLDSTDGQRHYQIWIGQPLKAAPERGYPVLWMLDGNAAIGALDPQQLKQLDQGQAPLLVAVGYQTPLRIERTARTYDYTPRQPGREVQQDPLTGQPSGGGEQFLQWLRERLRPAVAARVAIDPVQQTLWGHSYGGLLVLQALFEQPREFRHYAAASPSLWWGDGLILDQARGLAEHMQGHRAQLLLMRGGAEPGDPRQAATSTPAPDAEQRARQLRTQLAQVPGLALEYHSFEKLSHGQTLAASLHYVLERLYLSPDKD
ncbi:alpha/beta hydrolase [Pseudomonas piscis]|uniref:alpha/beta hydrolase n=1 Tax=Pseudomonas piscis TaxID=2614538 RepID=UPI0021D58DCB|nr:alpha/beta hydrolase [Pseudomonas piscis]MCU7646912.1 alpha/beta hydrolase [Pseudomonas piscis]